MIFKIAKVQPENKLNFYFFPALKSFNNNLRHHNGR
jgi:hypothetical protein